METVFTENLILQKIRDKIFYKKQDNYLTGTKPENFDICFCVSFDHYWQNLRDTEHEPLSTINFEISFQFSYFLGF